MVMDIVWEQQLGPSLPNCAEGASVRSVQWAQPESHQTQMFQIKMQTKLHPTHDQKAQIPHPVKWSCLLQKSLPPTPSPPATGLCTCSWSERQQLKRPGDKQACRRNRLLHMWELLVLCWSFSCDKLTSSGFSLNIWGGRWPSWKDRRFYSSIYGKLMT